MRQRARRAVAVDNDRRLLDAAVTGTVAGGLDALTVTGVPAAAGLTTGALYARYENLGGLFAALWSDRCRARFARFATDVRTLRHAGPRSSGGRAAVAAMISPDEELTTAIQLLVAAPRVDELADIVPDQLVADLVAAGYDRAGATPEGVTDLGTLIAAVGVAALRRAPGLPRPDRAALAALLCRPLVVPTAALPEAFAPTAELIGDPDDEVRDALLRGVQVVIARSGVTRATMSRIGRAAGLTPSALYGRYTDRTALVCDLLDRAQHRAIEPGRRALLATDPVVAAAAWRAWGSPAGRVRRRIFIEVTLAAAHDPVLAAQFAKIEGGTLRKAADLVADRFPSPAVALTKLCLVHSVGAGAGVLVDVLGLPDSIDWRAFTATVDGVVDR